MSKTLLTPKDLADAVGVSESSMRRWIDSGRLKMTRTAGGHRRIELNEALRFIRESGTPLVRGELLGIGDLAGQSESAGTEDEQLFNALMAGNAGLVRGLLMAGHARRGSLASVFDGPLRTALERLGELWHADAHGILIEHRATEICNSVIHEMRSGLPTPAEDAPLALGTTPGEEWHALTSQMASAVAREAGLRDINYGAGAPIDVLTSEAVRQGARLVWLSVTINPRRTLRNDIKEMAEELSKTGIELVVGGRHAHVLARHRNIQIVASMSEFAALIAGLRDAKPV